MLNQDTCNLCGVRHGQTRNGRLGRYNLTCDRCEARKGSHLIHTPQGYGSRAALRSEAGHAQGAHTTG